MRLPLLVLVCVSLVYADTVPSTSCANGHAICKQDGIRSPPPLSQQVEMMQAGRRIQRGPNWQYGNEDGGPGSVGEVMGWNTGSDSLFWVRWSNGNYRMYVMQAGQGNNAGTFELMFSQDELESLQDCWDTDGTVCLDGSQCSQGDRAICGYRTCNAGFHYDCNCADGGNTDEHHSSCCVLGGILYPIGRYNNFCVPMQCVKTHGKEDGFWITQPDFNADCKKCRAWWDPHVRTFDSTHSFPYQGCGEYSMVQQGVSYSPEFGVFSRFKDTCGSSVSCVSAAIMQEDNIQIMAESPRMDTEVFVTVNGVDYNIPIGQADFVPVEGNDKLLAWKWPQPWLSNCVFFQGTKGLLVQFCGNSYRSNTLDIWAMPDLSGQLLGLCGTLTNDASDDFITRQGKVMEYPSILNYPYESLEDWGTSWLTDPQSSIECTPSTGRANLGAKETCTNFDAYKAQCTDTISNFGSNLDSVEIEDLISACTYDLCNVDNPEVYLEEAVAETVKIQNVVEEHTINMTSDDACSKGLENVGGECFKIINNGTTFDWETAKSLCETDGLYLAEPWDIVAVATYLRENHGQYFFWIGGRGDEKVPRWVSGGVINETESWYHEKMWSNAGNSDRCVELLSHSHAGTSDRGILYAWPCESSHYGVPLCSPTQRPAQ